jgi:hypothetical protein
VTPQPAIEAFRATLKYLPDHPIPLSNLVILENRICDWSRREKHTAALRRALAASLREGRSLMTPFHAAEFEVGGGAWLRGSFLFLFCSLANEWKVEPGGAARQLARICQVCSIFHVIVFS